MKLKRKIGIRDWLNIAAILLFIGLIVWIALSYTKVFGKVDTRDLVGSAENFRTLITAYGDASIVAMVAVQAFHVVISVIPSIIVSFVGGMIFGVPLGVLTGTIGSAIGTAITFYLARLLGRRMVTLFVSEKNQQKLAKLMSSDTSLLMLLALFILPTPKDFFAYIIGPTNMKASKFFLISAVGRIPGQLVSCYLGAHIFDRNYFLLGGVVAACVVFTIFFFIYKDRIMALFNRNNRKEKEK